MTRRRQLEVVPAFYKAVMPFIDANHRHHGRPTGYIFAGAVADEDGRIVGAYTVGRPVAKHLQDGWTVEVTRTVTLGTRNANSALYGSAWRAARAIGYRRAVTYTEDGETGASLRASGWMPEAELPPRSGWDHPSRPRQPGRDFIGRTRWVVFHGARPKTPPIWPVVDDAEHLMLPLEVS